MTSEKAVKHYYCVFSTISPQRVTSSGGISRRPSNTYHICQACTSKYHLRTKVELSIYSTTWLTHTTAYETEGVSPLHWLSRVIGLGLGYVKFRDYVNHDVEKAARYLLPKKLYGNPLLYSDSVSCPYRRSSLQPRQRKLPF